MDKFRETLQRYFNGTSSEDDLKNLFRWFNSHKGHDEIIRQLESDWNTFKTDDSIDVDSRKMIIQIKNRIGTSSKNGVFRVVKQMFPYAAMLVIGFITAWIYFSNRNTGTISQEPLATAYTSVITENGQRSRIVLPDSSIVWLNSGTTLSYSNDFSEKNRKVTLNGQAFFQVARNAEKPFTVQTGELLVSVLGTRFDVDAFPGNGEIVVVLESGRVELTHRNIESFSYTMKPGELAAYNLTDNSMKVSTTDASVYSSWKDGKLIFRNTSMKNVIEKLRKWYNVNITVTNPEVYQSIFTGTIQNESYEEIFRLIEIACPINCKIIHNYEKETKPEIIISKN